jgi:hypothetical protein
MTVRKMHLAESNTFGMSTRTTRIKCTVIVTYAGHNR